MSSFASPATNHGHFLAKHRGLMENPIRETDMEEFGWYMMEVLHEWCGCDDQPDPEPPSWDYGDLKKNKMQHSDFDLNSSR